MSNDQTTNVDMAAIRARLAESDAPQFWRSLGQLAESDEFEAFLEDEFPMQSRPLRMEMDRRQFMILSGASLALAGMTGCRWLPQDKIVPYVRQPEELVPGKPLYYTSAYNWGGYGRGVLVESHEGRPTKIEGNPDHPASLGKTDAIMQATTLTLYDPDRSQNVLSVGEVSSWQAFLTPARQAMVAQKAKAGAGLHILTETITSPSLYGQIQTILKAYPQAQWHQYEPVGHDNIRQGGELAFGQPVNTIYHFDKATRILSLDSDFLVNMPGSVRYANDYSQQRQVHGTEGEMSRIYAVECTPTLVGAQADHRLPLKASQIDAFARAVAAKVGVPGMTETALPAEIPADWFEAMTKDLTDNRGSSIVIAGDHQPPAVHAVVHAINAALGNVGSTVVYTAPVEAQPTHQVDSLKNLVQEMQAGKVEMLLILGGNPVYNAPADLNFGQQLTKVPLRAHLSLFNDETSALCQWHLPETHFLEAWGDIRAHDGTASVVQPLIAPLYEAAHSAPELLAALTEDPRTGYEIVRDHWRNVLASPDFERVWADALNAGMLPATALPAKTFALSPNLAASLPPVAPAASGTAAPAADGASVTEVVFAPDPTIWDGRHVNNGWLQELPKPLTKTTWDNVVLMSPTMMERLGIQREDKVEITVAGRKVSGPAWMSFGHADNAVTLHLGYGRTRAGQVGNEVGYDAYQVRTSDEPWIATGATLKRTGLSHDIATTENHHIIEGKNIDSQHGRDIIHVSSLDEYRKSRNSKEGERKEPVESMYPDVVGSKEEVPVPLRGTPLEQPLVSNYAFDYSEFNAWAMTIDMNTCIGCNACTLACVAENNTPVVGKDQVMRGREMHWIRIDRYYEGGVDNPATYFQPLACQHCEKAPCEPVCPVAATVHSHDGLNQMVYNRCLGTKYCSNNCPYKVRRFNFLNYANHFETPVLMLSKNPDVTVRGRGVMEKCTYCVQRISRARIESKKKYDPKNPAASALKDGDVVTACQQACPTNAIIFGDQNDPKSKVSLSKAQPQDYILLEELNTRPRTTYLGRLRNPNPSITTGKES